MLKYIHNHRKSLIGVMVIAAICLVMTGFGVDYFASRDRNYVIKVGDVEVSWEQYRRERDELEEAMQARFGSNFWAIAQSLKLDLDQQTVDKLVSELLYGKEAARIGLEIGDIEVRTTIQQIFGEDFSPEMYSAFLRRKGFSGAAFEERLRRALLVDKLRALVQDASVASLQEAELLMKQEKTAYAVEYLSLDPDSYLEQVATPADEELERWYTDRASEYEQPARVSYRHAVFDPSEFRAAVDVAQEDLELYYVDRQQDFLLPKQVKAARIQLFFPPESDTDAIGAVKKRAQEIHEKAVAGEAFSKLAELYSEDIASKMRGGDIGWVAPKVMSQQFDESVFAMSTPGIVDLIATDKAYEIVKVEEIRDAALKPLEEVREQIESEIRDSLAPAYARDRAEALLEKLRAGGSFIEIAADYGAASAVTDGAIDEKTDPADLQGLTRQVLLSPYEEFQLIDLGHRTVVVQVEQFVEPFVPSFSELGKIKLQAQGDFKVLKAAELAHEAAQQILEEAESDTSLAEVIKRRGYEVQKVKNVTRAEAGTGEFSVPKLRDALFSIHQEGALSAEPLEIEGNYIVFQVVSIEAPDVANLQNELQSYRLRAQNQSAQLLLQSLENRLKAETPVDILIAQTGE